ncbi:D-2-hydroxyacid dehydrogenase [Candidatus Bipolaricaulota bacterium]
MTEPTNVLVFLRESTAPYRERLIDSDAARYLFCESQKEIEKHIEAADVILGSIGFPAALLPRASRLKWIQVTGAGVDRFLAQGELPAGVVLTRAVLSFGEQISEYVIGHLLALTQHLRTVHASQEARHWEPLTVEFLRGRTLGVAGVGSIGQAVAERARAMGMRTVGLTRSARELAGFDRSYGSDQRDAFLSDLDGLVLCLPLTADTRGWIGRDELACMKPSAILVNVSRGAILDEPALVDALRERRIRAAILDVFAEEPLPATSPLWTLDNVTITSHHAGLNVPVEMIEFFLGNLARFRSGRLLEGLVDPDRGY